MLFRGQIHAGHGRGFIRVAVSTLALQSIMKVAW